MAAIADVIEARHAFAVTDYGLAVDDAVQFAAMTALGPLGNSLDHLQ
jgi:hypothetical protein